MTRLLKVAPLLAKVLADVDVRRTVPLLCVNVMAPVLLKAPPICINPDGAVKVPEAAARARSPVIVRFRVPDCVMLLV